MPPPSPLPLPFEPRQTLLFSGHRIDSPGRTPPRFPPHLEAAAAARIAEALDALAADASDIALTQGASGGDLLFAEACTQRGVPVQLLLPLPETEFIAQSILPSADGERWKQRFLDLKTRLPWPPQSLQSPDGDAFERGNLWLLATALACGADKLRLICLWNGADDNGPGGTAHMLREVKRHKGRIIRIDTRMLR